MILYSFIETKLLSSYISSISLFGSTTTLQSFKDKAVGLGITTSAVLGNMSLGAGIGSEIVCEIIFPLLSTIKA